MALSDLTAALSDLSKIQSIDGGKGRANSGRYINSKRLIIWQVIFDIASEAEYWRIRAKSAQANHCSDWESAETIYRHLKSAADATQRLQLHSDLGLYWRNPGDSFDFFEYFTETLEYTVLDGLDDVWRMSEGTAFTPYPESRMRSLIEAITGWICRTLVAFFNSVETKSELSLVWYKPLKQVSMFSLT